MGVGGVASGKYGMVVFAVLQRAFDAVWRKGTLYKLHKANIFSQSFPAFSQADYAET